MGVGVGWGTTSAVHRGFHGPASPSEACVTTTPPQGPWSPGSVEHPSPASSTFTGSGDNLLAATTSDPGVGMRAGAEQGHARPSALTRRKQGLTNFQHSRQYRLGRCPIICLMSSLNCRTPGGAQKGGQDGTFPETQVSALVLADPSGPPAQSASCREQSHSRLPGWLADQWVPTHVPHGDTG